MRTPWGRSQTRHEIAPGIVAVTTPGHGGIHVDDALNSQIPEEWRRHAEQWADPGWYEEDCCWAYVALTFPQHFGIDAVVQARSTVDWLEKQEKINGVSPESRTT